MKKIFTLPTLFFLAVLLAPMLLHAQSDPGADPDTAPIDGGLSILLASGVGYGVKKIREKRNK